MWAKKIMSKEGSEPMIIDEGSGFKINDVAGIMGHILGFILDFTGVDIDGKPLNFNDLEKRERAWKLVEDKQGWLIICSPLLGMRGLAKQWMKESNL